MSDKVTSSCKIAGLKDACDLWLETQARNGKLFGTACQLLQNSQSSELTRDYWDRFANAHNLRRLAACCEAFIEHSPQVGLAMLTLIVCA